ncbi:MAG TPA: hypothetical protein VK754_00495 [Propionibacteriaceae bacterium]|nr:hypothetical protein [Propionibacteriaceae bacterium]
MADGGREHSDLILWTPPEGPDGVDLAEYADAGATWWLQGEELVRPNELRRRIALGPRTD